MSRPRPADAENAGPTGTVSASAVAIGNVVRGFGAEVSGNGGGGGDADDVKISFRQGACVKAGEPGMQAGATTSGGPVQRIDNNQTIPLGELQLARESVQQAKALLVRLRGLVLALPGAPGTSFRATLELDPSRFVVYFAPLAGQRKLELLLTAPALDRFLQVAADKRQLQITFAAKIDGSKFIRAAGAEAHLQDPHLPIEQSGAAAAATNRHTDHTTTKTAGHCPAGFCFRRNITTTTTEHSPMPVAPLELTLISDSQSLPSCVHMNRLEYSRITATAIRSGTIKVLCQQQQANLITNHRQKCHPPHQAPFGHQVST
jgi:hypothetical protein